MIMLNIELNWNDKVDEFISQQTQNILFQVYNLK